MGRLAFIEAILKPLGFGVYRAHKKYADQAVVNAALRYKKMLVPAAAEKLNYTVVRGPFQGMRLPTIGAWSDYDVLAKIVGSYEAEIFAALENEIARKPDVIVNIGASEGYYAIGLKRHLADAKVFTFDIDVKSFPALEQCMKMNDVSVTRLNEFNYDAPLSFMKDGEVNKALFFLDCEGFENHVVEMPHKVVSKSSFIIELHDLFVPGTREKLVAFLSDTHIVSIIDQSVREPRDYPELSGFRRPVVQMLLDEFREDAMQWLYAVPK